MHFQRIVPGMKVLGQIALVQPLALIISLPNQLMGHVPITQVTSQLTNRLESMHEQEEPSDAESVDDGESDSQTEVPDLFQLFHVGQYVRAVVTNVHASGTTDVSGIGKLRDDAAKASRRIELSLVPKTMNSGVLKADLKPGFVSDIFVLFSFHHD
jgi:rRNA biogenesis protein RRP5